MKKKSNLLLLLLLPLLTSCPPSLDGPLFDVEEFPYYNKMLWFDLEDGLDLTLSYGLYNKSLGYSGNSTFDKFMFLVANAKDPYQSSVRYERIYEVPSPNSQHYWKEPRNGNGYTYTSEAKIHIDSKYFNSDNDVFTVVLAQVEGYSPEKNFYDSESLFYYRGYVDYQPFYYYIAEDQTVYVSTYRERLPNYSASEESSKESQDSSSEEELLSTEESLESSKEAISTEEPLESSEAVA